MWHKFQFLLIKLIHLYQGISRNKPPVCRYQPSCSNYMIGSMEEWGLIRGLCLGIWRILRCHPFAEQRVDEVPINKKKRGRIE